MRYCEFNPANPLGGGWFGVVCTPVDVLPSIAVLPEGTAVVFHDGRYCDGPDSMVARLGVVPYPGRLTVISEVVVDDRDSELASCSSYADMSEACRAGSTEWACGESLAGITSVHCKW